MGMYPPNCGKCKTCDHPIENHCSDDAWCPKCGETGHIIELKSEFKNVRFG